MKRQFANPARLGIPALSLVIVSVLLFQASISVPWRFFASRVSMLEIVGDKLKAPLAWPFLDYSMYSPSHYDGEELPQTYVFATLEDSTEVEIVAADLGVNFFQFNKGIVSALEANDTSRIYMWAELYEGRNDKRLTGLRLENRPMIFTRDGLQTGETEILANFRFEPGVR